MRFDRPTLPPDFTQRSFLGLTIASVFLLAPVAMANIVEGRSNGIAIFTIILVLGVNSLSVVFRGTYYPNVTLVTFVPATALAVGNSLHNVGPLGIAWSYPAILAFYAILPERRAWIANILFLVLVAPELFATVDAGSAMRVSISLLMSSVVTGVFLREILRQQRQLRDLAVTDPLTQVYNRVMLDRLLDEAAQRHARNGSPVTLMALDLDHFKAINDTFGHSAGDAVLKGVASILKGRLRGSDQIFRMGGEEFIILLPDTDATSASVAGEDLRSAIAASSLLPTYRVTVSLGVAMRRDGESNDEWMKRADTNLYAAKLGGRDQLVA